MGIVKSKDLEKQLDQMKNGVCPVWGYSTDRPNKRSLSRGKWTVNKEGDIVFDGYYHIQKDRLQEIDWIIHLMDKTWFDFNEFMPIYMQAHFNAGIKEIKIKIYK